MVKLLTTATHLAAVLNQFLPSNGFISSLKRFPYLLAFYFQNGIVNPGL